MAFWARHFGKKLASDEEADDFCAYLSMLVDRSTVSDTAKLALMKLTPGTGFYSMIMTARSFGRTPDPRPKIRNSPVPILVIKGQYDNQKWGFTHEYLDLFPHHRLVVIPGAGHSISAEQPELFLRTVRDFLRE
jgi:proline iminopeptidase